MPSIPVAMMNPFGSAQAALDHTDQTLQEMIPLDKYYLSDEGDPLDSYFSRNQERTHSKYKSSRYSSKHDAAHADSSPKRSSGSKSTASRRHDHNNSSKSPHSHPRDSKEVGRSSRYMSPSPDGYADQSTARSAHRSQRPKSSRAASSYHHSSRPRTSRSSSSCLGSRPMRPSARRGLSDKSIRTMPKPVQEMVKRLDPKSIAEVSHFWDNFPWQEAAKVAMQAGTVAAIKVGADSSPWTAKGTKVASAALGAAVVDHVLKPKTKGGIKYAAMRHLTELAVANLVVGPAVGKAKSRTQGGSRRK
ncbi:hypothetical protein BD289DRAFT_478887 [Coniella lustricola]|uniref:Uncharacterized protein n=1 Tax=Coniella lustricola TaxID=2025994 RepID=A0A2T3AKS0_9PEZI|nr:hypothetical protein BD289DRAFT_478887 [Coniella lustricola]